VGRIASGKGAGTKFNPGANRPSAGASKTGAPEAGWKTWDEWEGGHAGGGKQATPEPVEPISPEVVAQLRRESQQSLVQSVAVQWSVSVIVALIALIVGGKAAGLSGLLGAACVALPNSLLAFKLLMNSMRPDGGSGTTVLVGEFVKIGAVVLLLVLVVKLGGALIVWPALLAGLIAALKSYWVMLAMASIQRKGP
jgi:ATP synthase protein I